MEFKHYKRFQGEQCIYTWVEKMNQEYKFLFTYNKTNKNIQFLNLWYLNKSLSYIVKRHLTYCIPKRLQFSSITNNLKINVLKPILIFYNKFNYIIFPFPGNTILITNSFIIIVVIIIIKVLLSKYYKLSDND